MKQETLHFKRMATKSKDGKDGVIYVHCFNNGYQELIFDNHEAAQRTKEKLNTPEYIEHLKQPA